MILPLKSFDFDKRIKIYFDDPDRLINMKAEYV